MSYRLSMRCCGLNCAWRRSLGFWILLAIWRSTFSVQEQERKNRWTYTSKGLRTTLENAIRYVGVMSPRWEFYAFSHQECTGLYKSSIPLFFLFCTFSGNLLLLQRNSHRAILRRQVLSHGKLIIHMLGFDLHTLTESVRESGHQHHSSGPSLRFLVDDTSFQVPFWHFHLCHHMRGLNFLVSGCNLAVYADHISTNMLWNPEQTTIFVITRVKMTLLYSQNTPMSNSSMAQLPMSLSSQRQLSFAARVGIRGTENLPFQRYLTFCKLNICKLTGLDGWPTAKRNFVCCMAGRVWSFLCFLFCWCLVEVLFVSLLEYSEELTR